MAALGVPPSRIIGETLERLLELVTDDPTLNEREKLLAAARGCSPSPARRREGFCRRARSSPAKALPQLLKGD